VIDLAVENVTAGYGRKSVLEDLSAHVAAGSMVGLIGPNGAGKSTLLKVIGRLLKPEAGTVRLGGEDLRRMPTRRLARRLAFLPQQPLAPPGISVRELVGYGRYPHVGRFRTFGPEDRRQIDRALDRCALQPMADRALETLSGGERQRAWVAMALAQQPQAMLLDEPLSFLDVNHQLEVLDLLGELNREHGLSVLLAMHDLNLAVRCCDRLIVMEAGRIAAAEPVGRILESEVIERVFRVRMSVHPEGASGRPLCEFHAASARSSPPAAG